MKNRNKNMKKEIVRMDRVTHIERGIRLLENFNIHIFEGEIMGLLCVNRNGLEAFLKILCRNIPIHYGYIFFNEELVNNYQHSSMKGNLVSIIEKQSHLVQDLTVADNIFVLRKEYHKYIIDSRELSVKLKQFTEEIAADIEGDDIVSRLTETQKFMVEILKAVISGSRLIVIRELSSFIGKADVLKIHEIMRYYTSKGISFLYVCNHHEEAFEICNRAAMMENGKILKILDHREFHDKNITPYSLDFSKRKISLPGELKEPGPGMMKFKNISSGSIRNMNLSIAQGECLVILDTDNSAIQEMQQMLKKPESAIEGKIVIDGSVLQDNAKMAENQMKFIDESPLKSMIFPDMSYIDNLCFLMDKKTSNIWMKKKIKKSVASEYFSLAGEDIFARDIRSLEAKSLYNMVYYRIHLYSPKVAICIQPFSGADMYLRHHIATLIRKLLEKKISVIILALNISDTLSVADRLIVMKEGKIFEEYDSKDFTSFKQKS